MFSHRSDAALLVCSLNVVVIVKANKANSHEAGARVSAASNVYTIPLSWQCCSTVYSLHLVPSVITHITSQDYPRKCIQLTSLLHFDQRGSRSRVWRRKVEREKYRRNKQRRFREQPITDAWICETTIYQTDIHHFDRLGFLRPFRLLDPNTRDTLGPNKDKKCDVRMYVLIYEHALSNILFGVLDPLEFLSVV